METEKIYIVQMHTGTLPARCIRFFTRYPYSHVGLSLTKDCNVIYSFGRRSLHNVLNGGFVKEHRQGAFFGKFSRTVCRVYELEVSREQYTRIREHLAFMEADPDRFRYDFFGFFLRLFHIRATFRNRYVCSTFVADVLEQSDVCRFDKALCFVKPIDFEGLEGAVEIYTGAYHNQLAG